MNIYKKFFQISNWPAILLNWAKKTINRFKSNPLNLSANLICGDSGRAYRFLETIPAKPFFPIISNQRFYCKPAHSAGGQEIVSNKSSGESPSGVNCTSLINPRYDKYWTLVVSQRDGVYWTLIWHEHYRLYSPSIKPWTVAEIQENEPKFFEWLAGVIDGDGHFEIKGNSAKLVISMGTEDLPLLEYIKSLVGGQIYKVAKKNAYTYIIQRRSLIMVVAKGINGHIRNSVRLPQFKEACEVLDIIPLDPIPLTPSSPYFSGFFDADGTIYFSFRKGRPEIVVKMTNKYKEDLVMFVHNFRGSLYLDKRGTTSYYWSVQSYSDVTASRKFFKYCRSRKSQRFHLISEFYSLRDLSAFEPNNSLHHKWIEFTKRWNWEK